MEASPINIPPPACSGCAERDRRIAELEKLIRDLKSRLDKLEEAARAAKRQAAPFSKGLPKSDAKRPGRKSGEAHGRHAHRAAPAEIDQTLEAPLPIQCPHCQGKVIEEGVRPQYQTEIPRRVIHRQFNVHVGRCECCGKQVTGRHPLQTSDAVGAAASQIGPDAQALVVQLNKEAGLSHGKIQRFFRVAFELDLSRATACRIMLRAGKRLEPTCRAIIRRVRQSPFIVPDETGWRVGGLSNWLHVAVGADATAYLVHPNRGYEAAVELIGADYAGFLTHDGWSPYAKFNYAIHQTCLGHLARRSHELEQSAQGVGARFPRQVKALIKEALAVRDQRDAGQITAAQAIAQAQRLSRRTLDLVAPSQTNEANDRFAAHLWNLQQSDSLFTFLQYPGIDATNHKAEQAIRPAVVNRKVWGGNRTDAGAKAQSILMSVIQTTKQRGTDTLSYISSALKACFGQAPLLIPDTG